VKTKANREPDGVDEDVCGEACLGPGPRPIQLTTAKVAMKMAVETGKPIDREGVRADKAVPAKLKQQRRRGGM
jgi:hypothetical protein